MIWELIRPMRNRTKFFDMQLFCKYALLDVGIDEFRSFSDLIDDDVYEAISLLTCVNNRTITGSPSPKTVKTALDRASLFV